MGWWKEQIRVPNTSKGMHSILLEWTEEFRKEEYKTCILMTESQDVADRIGLLLPWIEECKGIPEVADLNIEHEVGEVFDIVICQATLEHVARPSIAIENLIRKVKYKGLLLLHTHIPGFPYHRHPVDCVRFYPDFFRELERYIPFYKLLKIEIHDTHIFVAVRKE